MEYIMAIMGSAGAGAGAASAASGVAGASALAAGIEPALVNVAATAGGGGGLLGGLGSAMSNPQNIGLLGQAMMGGDQQKPQMQHDLSPVQAPQQGSFANTQKEHLKKNDPYMFSILYPNG